MRRLAFTVAEHDVEEVLDALLPLLPHGVHPSPPANGAVELGVFDVDGRLPPREALEAAIGERLRGVAEEDAPEDAGERRVRYLRPAAVGGRVVVRPSDSPPPAGDGILDVIVDSPDGAFGSGGHPTTRMCLELLLELEPGGAFADLGCGAGVLAVTAARLGFSPVVALDHEITGVRATRANAARNGVEVDAVVADLLEIEPPPAATVAANVPLAVHEHLAAHLPPEVRHLIVSGLVDGHLPPVMESYARAGLRVAQDRVGPGWVAVLLERDA
jgi:ribosomal protein L11 methyltransferase